MRIKENIVETILFVAAIFMCIGVQTIFPACPPKDDGSFMVCHWAQQTICAMGGLMAAMSVIGLFTKSKDGKAAVSGCIAAASAVTFFIPNIIIRLCMMNEMHCHAVMKPSVWVISVIIFLLSLINIFLKLKKTR